MNDQLMYDHLVSEIKKTVPGFKVVNKRDSRLMKVLSVILFFNKDFMTNFYTTIYHTVYLPTSVKEGQEKFTWGVLAHEWVHLLRGDLGFAAFAFRYLFPLSLLPLALFSLLAIWGSNLWLWNLLWLLAAAPFPSYFKAYEERIAYRMTLAVEIWRFGSTTDASREYLAQHFTSSEYYFMWPFKKMVKRWLDKEEQDILNGKYQNVAPYSTLYDLIKKEKAGLLEPLE